MDLRRRIWSAVIGALLALATLALFYHFAQSPTP
jgi:uncharacterized membrane protein YgaE (UPF0421/DUF939 family)